MAAGSLTRWACAAARAAAARACSWMCGAGERGRAVERVKDAAALMWAEPARQRQTRGHRCVCVCVAGVACVFGFLDPGFGLSKDSDHTRGGGYPRFANWPGFRIHKTGRCQHPQGCTQITHPATLPITVGSTHAYTGRPPRLPAAQGAAAGGRLALALPAVSA